MESPYEQQIQKMEKAILVWAKKKLFLIFLKYKQNTLENELAQTIAIRSLEPIEEEMINSIKELVSQTLAKNSFQLKRYFKEEIAEETKSPDLASLEQAMMIRPDNSSKQDSEEKTTEENKNLNKSVSFKFAFYKGFFKSCISFSYENYSEITINCFGASKDILDDSAAVNESYYLKTHAFINLAAGIKEAFSRVNLVEQEINRGVSQKIKGDQRQANYEKLRTIIKKRNILDLKDAAFQELTNNGFYLERCEIDQVNEETVKTIQIIIYQKKESDKNVEINAPENNIQNDENSKKEGNELTKELSILLKIFSDLDTGEVNIEGFGKEEKFPSWQEAQAGLTRIIPPLLPKD